jgi:hypothetical protein
MIVTPRSIAVFDPGSRLLTPSKPVTFTNKPVTSDTCVLKGTPAHLARLSDIRSEPFVPWIKTLVVRISKEVLHRWIQQGNCAG